MKRFGATLTLILLFFSATSLLAQAATPAAPTGIGEMLASLPQARSADGGFVVGEPSAPITIIEFADYACPHCQNYRPTIDPILEQYVASGEAKFELRIFPTAGGQLTYYVGQLAECANHQRLGDFWRAYDLLYDYATSGQYDQEVGARLATDLDLNNDKLEHCAETAQQVGKDITFGTQQGVTGTPTIMVRYHDGNPSFISAGGRTYNAGGVPYDVLAQVIEAANALPIQPSNLNFVI